MQDEDYDEREVMKIKRRMQDDVYRIPSPKWKPCGTTMSSSMICSDQDFKPRPFQERAPKKVEKKHPGKGKYPKTRKTQVADGPFCEKIRHQSKNPVDGSCLMYSCKCRGRHVFSANVPPTTFMPTQPNSWDNLEKQRGS